MGIIRKKIHSIWSHKLFGLDSWGDLIALSGLLLVLLSFGLDFFGQRRGFGLKQLLILLPGALLLASSLVADHLWGGRRLIGGIAGRLREFEQNLQFGLLMVLLWLLIFLIRQFDLENPALQNILLPLVFWGFLVHFMLPQNLQLPFFALLSLFGILAILKFEAIWLLGLGGILLGVAHLPVNRKLRGGILLAVGLVMAAMRAGWLAAPWEPMLWPFIGSMFFLRLLIYFYDLKSQKEPANPWISLTYLFILPNAVFLLFPPVDFTHYKKGYFKQSPFETYQKGLKWIFWGIIHLLVYRIVNYYFTLAAHDVDGIAALLKYVISTFLLYLRVIGQARIALGMLHLFGFDLPRPFNVHYLSSNFTDFWRRANTYWKDLMQKLFFYPLYFKLRRRGHMPALIIATFLNFVVAWFLHAVQWFWLLGSFLLAVPDILFWSLLAAFVAVNVYFEARRPAKPLEKQAQTTAGWLRYSLKVTGFFLTMALLWSMWTSPSLDDWLALFSLSGITGSDLAAAAGILAGLAAVIAAGIWIETHGEKVLRRLLWGGRAPAFYGTTAQMGVLAVGLLLLGSPAFANRLNPQAAITLLDLQQARLSTRDAALMNRGYYENIMGLEKINSEVWEVYMQKPDDWVDIWNSDVSIWTGDFLRYELRPSSSLPFHDRLFVTNEWGMRDLPYTQEKPANTFRIALMGGSRTVGSGVENYQKFEWLVENRLAQDYTKTDLTYQILDFSVGGYTMPQKVFILDRVMAFHPDVLVYIPHPDLEFDRSADHIEAVISEDLPITIPFIREIVEEAGLQPDMSRTEMFARLKPFSDRLIRESYAEIYRSAVEHGALPVWLTYDHLDESLENAAELAWLRDVAEELGFEIIDLSDVFTGWDLTVLRVAPWDQHPNATGHRLIAEALYNYLVDHDETFLGNTAP